MKSFRLSMNRKFTPVEIMIIVIVIGLLILMATPIGKVPGATKETKAAINNLRHFAFAAQQYMLDEGVTVVTFVQIVGPGKPIPTIEQAADETYTGLIVGTNTTRLEVTVNGRTVTYDF